MSLARRKRPDDTGASRNRAFRLFVLQPSDSEQPGRDAGHAAERHLDQRLLGHADRVRQLARIVPAAVRGVVPAQPLDGRAGPARLPRGQRAAALRGHVPGVRDVPHAVPGPPARRRGRRGRVRRAPGARGGRRRRGGPRRPAGLPVLPVRVPVLRGARAAPRPRARRGPAHARRVLRRRLPPPHVPAGLRGAHRVRGPRAGHVLQRPGRPARRRDRVLRGARVGLSGGHRHHGGRVHAGQGDRAHRVGRVRRLRHTVRRRPVAEQGESNDCFAQYFISECCAFASRAEENQL